MTAPRLRVRPLAACLVVALASASSRAAHVADWPDRSDGPVVAISTCADDGPGSLREAYFNAVDGETIDLSALTCSTITLDRALTDSGTAHYVTIQGPGQTLLTIDGAYRDRVLVHNGDGRLLLNDLTIAHGSYAGPYGGGCIYSYGGVVLLRATVANCSLTTSGSAKAYGGAILAQTGRVVAERSTIRDAVAHANDALAAGGGIWANQVALMGSTVTGNRAIGASDESDGGGVFSLGDTAVRYSLLANNEATRGGAIFMAGASAYPLLVIDSTVSGNQSSGAGGGVYAKYQDLTIENSTIAGNRSGFEFGAGLYLATDGTTTTLASTIVSGNTSEDGLYAADVGGNAGAIVAGSSNLVIASTLALPADTLRSDPLLGPLKDNGGLTLTHALGARSPAIDAGANPEGLACEQRANDRVTGRRYYRENGERADIGAWESPPDQIFEDGFDGEVRQAAPEDGPFCHGTN